ncbi:hypothetical protein [Sediminispirochaeta bajacaliforniensis]|uniref:hypothetical protein n=1 Tax=Sediminispirochaeta bajacaliforniensis TaxID=148 RepID=UPI000368B7BC|nr:hypothetical protein [Sediminispirochaeta bajacaliforniensis]
MKKIRQGLLLAVCTLVAVILLLSLTEESGWPHRLRDIITQKGIHDTGASNLVAAVYLGYRALDTLGETVVLLLAVSGLLFILKNKGKE